MKKKNKKNYEGSEKVAVIRERKQKGLLYKDYKFSNGCILVSVFLQRAIFWRYYFNSINVLVAVSDFIRCKSILLNTYYLLYTLLRNNALLGLIVRTGFAVLNKHNSHKREQPGWEIIMKYFLRSCFTFFVSQQQNGENTIRRKQKPDETFYET